MNLHAFGPSSATPNESAVSIPNDQLIAARLRWGLTARQAEIVGRLALGLSNKEIASELDCTVGNVEQHVTAIFRRTGVTNRATLLARFWTAR